VYETPSLHLELARLKHKDYEIEAGRARLAAQVPREPAVRFAVVKGAISGLRTALLRRRPAVAHEARLQPAA
jgi:hypothetical protein